jgi:hypothetical protein
VLRFIDWALGSTGEELLACTRLDPEDLAGVVNGLMDAGYVESIPYVERTDAAALPEQRFEVNPGYALALKEAMIRR